MKHKIIFTILIALVLATVAPAAAFAQSADVGGIVTGDGVPLQGAQVTIEQLFRGGLPKSVTALETAADGSWSYIGKLGMYRLTFTAAGFHSYTTTVEMKKDGTYPLDVDLSAVAPPVGTITGRITALSGNGLHGYVYFYKQNADGTWPEAYLQVVESEYTGAYSSGDLPLGTYKVKLFSVMSGWEWYSNAATMDLATPIVLDTSGQVVTGIDAQLP